MTRVIIAIGPIASLALAAGVQVSSMPAFPDRTTRAGRVAAEAGATVQECRTAATAATTHSKAAGFSAETATTCH